MDCKWDGINLAEFVKFNPDDFVVLALNTNDNKDTQIPSKHNKFIILYHFQATCFDSLRVIIRPSNELTQDYLIPIALWDPVALTIVGVIVL